MPQLLSTESVTTLQPCERQENRSCTEAAAEEVCKILVVEDERTCRRAMDMLLSASGYQTECFATAEEALSALEAGFTPQIALVDLDLPGMNGIQFILRMKDIDSSIEALVISATDERTLADQVRSRRLPYMQKPIQFPVLLERLGHIPMHA